MRALVEATLRRLNLPAQDLWRDEVADAWERVAPPEIAKLLRPGKWEQGVLYFYVPNSVRLFEIQRQHLRAIEAGLRQRLGAARLRQVRLMIDPDAAASTGRPIG